MFEIYKMKIWDKENRLYGMVAFKSKVLTYTKNNLILVIEQTSTTVDIKSL